MLTEKQINALPQRVYELFQEVNKYYLEKTGETIKKIGTMSKADAYRYLRLRQYGTNITKIKREIAKAIDKSVKEVDEIFSITANDTYNDAKIFYDAQNLEYIPLGENKPLNNIISRYTKQVKEQLFGIAQTTAFAYFDPVVDDFFLSDLSTAYQKIVEQGVLSVNTGVTDYQSAMRRVIRTMADNGIKRVDYATGYNRRLDTSVRQNILWGVKQCNQELQIEMGKQFNADGVEVSYHSRPRPSHAPMGGIQFALGQYDAVVKGKVYPAFEAPYKDEKPPKELLEEYNCYHFTFPIILGVSEPNWTEEQLEEMKRKDNETFEFEGKKYNGYQATQMQRKLETAIRNEKDRQIAFAASGDDVGRRAAQSKINTLQNKYKEFSSAVNLSEKKHRTSVSGYHKVKTQLEYEDSIRNHIKSPTQPKTIDIGKQNKHIPGTNEFKVIADNLNKNNEFGPSRLTISLEELQGLIDNYHGTGNLLFRKDKWSNQEIILTNDKIIGYAVNNKNGEEALTTVFKIHYNKKGTHIVPDYPSKKRKE